MTAISSFQKDVRAWLDSLRNRRRHGRLLEALLSVFPGGVRIQKVAGGDAEFLDVSTGGLNT